MNTPTKELEIVPLHTNSAGSGCQFPLSMQVATSDHFVDFPASRRQEDEVLFAQTLREGTANDLTIRGEFLRSRRWWKVDGAHDVIAARLCFASETETNQGMHVVWRASWPAKLGNYAWSSMISEVRSALVCHVGGVWRTRIIDMYIRIYVRMSYDVHTHRP